ncbi:MAG: protein kinase [Deltaproteobacteria bacterium]|nr:protein kinase [Deltaproteobacteria bacterium]
MATRDTHEELSLISGKYQVLGLAGRGGTGMVYKVRHLALDTIFALKVLPAEFRDNTEVVTRFHQEARVMARFNHPNIVRVSDVDKDGSTPYFVMEYVEGRSLSEYLADRGPLSVREALEITRQVALALDYAHSHATAVVHRDIKPQNILVETDSQRAVVTDFGIAKVRGASVQTSVDLMLGTLLYCAPEQILPNGDIDGRADLYSLGLVLYEMVTRRAFFADIDERTLVGKVLSAEENVPVFPTPVPAEFAALVRRAISRKLENRYQNAKELLKDIDACLALSSSSLEVQAPAQPLVTASSVTEHLQREALIPPAEPPRVLPREPSAEWYPAWAPVGGLLLAGVVSLWWLLGAGSTTPVSPIPENPTVVAAVPSPDPALAPPVSIPENTTETTIEPQPQSPSLSTPPVPVETETPASATTIPVPPASESPTDVAATEGDELSGEDPSLDPTRETGEPLPPGEGPPPASSPSDRGETPDNQPFPGPRRFRITTQTAVRESPTWASKEALWLQPGARVYAVAQVGDWLKVESRAQPPKPPGFVWKADTRRE